MKNKFYIYLLYFFTSTVLIFLHTDISSQPQRFPQPEFHTDYEIPEVDEPSPRSGFMEYMDLIVLSFTLGLACWLVFKKRSRRLILYLSFFSLIYFGFYKNGCICSVGSFQNIALGIFNDYYSSPYVVIAFFAIPLMLALFAGRIFCGAVCPLGIIQDLFVLKPVKVPFWLRLSLGTIPFIYLGFAVVYAALDTDFLVCRYDPFVNIFRLGGSFNMVLLATLFLITGIFIARPFCRFFCPYGALLKICSINSQKHLTITPKDCINCNLCKDACPFSSIEYPNEHIHNLKKRNSYKRFITYSVLVPILFFVGAYSFSSAYKYFANMHPDVRFATQIADNPNILNDSRNINVEALQASGISTNEYINSAFELRERFKPAMWWLGGFIGLVISISLLNQVIFRKRSIYEPNKGNCFSCGRCMDYCPVGKSDHPYFIENPEMKEKA